MPRGARKPGPHSSIYSNRLSRKSHFASQRPVSASAKMDKLKILPHRVIEGLYKSLTTGRSVFCTAVSPLFGIWFSSVQSLSRVRLFVTPWTAACQASLSITNSQNLLKLVSIELVIPSNHLILCHPFPSHLQSFPTSGSFQMSQFFASGGQSIGVSALASVLPMNIQDWI